MNRPRVEIRDGALCFVFEVHGPVAPIEYAYPLTVEGATEFAVELAAKLEELKGNPELMKTIAKKGVDLLVDLFARGRD